MFLAALRMIKSSVPFLLLAFIIPTDCSSVCHSPPGTLSVDVSEPSPSTCPDVGETFTHTIGSETFTVKPLHPVGAEVSGLDLRQRPSEETLKALEDYMATVGALLFRNQTLSGDEQVQISEYFGGREMTGSHLIHPKAPNEHILRLSNDRSEGRTGAGATWHNDGGFHRVPYSHVTYYMVKAPSKTFGGGTHFALTSKAYDLLTEEEKIRWENLVFITNRRGVVHPLVFTHPMTGRKHLFLYLIVLGAILDTSNMRLLTKEELTAVCKRYIELVSHPDVSTKFNWKTGDFLITDNLAVSHKADASAHTRATSKCSLPESHRPDLRILHRTTVKGTFPVGPTTNAIPGLQDDLTLDIEGPNPFNQDGVWYSGPTGFQWSPDISYAL